MRGQLAVAVVLLLLARVVLLQLHIQLLVSWLLLLLDRGGCCHLILLQRGQGLLVLLQCLQLLLELQLVLKQLSLLLLSSIHVILLL